MRLTLSVKDLGCEGENDWWVGLQYLYNFLNWKDPFFLILSTIKIKKQPKANITKCYYFLTSEIDR